MACVVLKAVLISVCRDLVSLVWGSFEEAGYPNL